MGENAHFGQAGQIDQSGLGGGSEALAVAVQVVDQQKSFLEAAHVDVDFGLEHVQIEGLLDLQSLFGGRNQILDFLESPREILESDAGLQIADVVGEQSRPDLAELARVFSRLGQRLAEVQELLGQNQRAQLEQTRPVLEARRREAERRGPVNDSDSQKDFSAQ